jgi:hypothetical protein
MSTVAYHLETHTNPRQVQRLVRTLRAQAPDSPIVVNHDARAPALDPALFRGLDVAVQIGVGGYSDLSHARRWLQTAQWLAEEGVDYDWLSNLSGQDYPVRPLGDVHRELAASEADAFLEYFDVFDADQSPWGLRLGTTRYTYSHRRVRPLTRRQMKVLRPLQVVNRLQPWGRLTTATGLTVGRRVASPWGRDLRLYGGSFFVTLRRPVVEFMCGWVVDHADVMEHWSHSLAPAEVFFQTALVNDGSFRLVNDCRRYFDFSATRFNHPKTLTSEDLPAVLASGKDFCRKVDDRVDAGLIDALDRQLAISPHAP